LQLGKNRPSLLICFSLTLQCKAKLASWSSFHPEPFLVFLATVITIHSMRINSFVLIPYLFFVIWYKFLICLLVYPYTSASLFWLLPSKTQTASSGDLG
jgi:hypothetical protein